MSSNFAKRIAIDRLGMRDLPGSVGDFHRMTVIDRTMMDCDDKRFRLAARLGYLFQTSCLFSSNDPGYALASSTHTHTAPLIGGDIARCVLPRAVRQFTRKPFIGTPY